MNISEGSELDFLVKGDNQGAYVTYLADYLIMGAIGAFTSEKQLKEAEKGFKTYTNDFLNSRESEKLLLSLFKQAQIQATKITQEYNRMSEKDFPRPQQTPPRRQSRGRSR